LAVSCLLWGQHEASALSVGGFVDVEACYDALQTADDNPRDGRVGADEYVTFVQELGPPGVFDDIESYQELPLRIQTTFILLACLCESAGEGQDCCIGENAHINTSGSGPDEIPTPEEQSYLYRVCFLTDSAIEDVLSSERPSSIPSESPTMIPSESPTDKPTLSPVTGPTPMPTESPTKGPTPAPTPGPPTVSPTPKPTTSEPSDAPTFEGQTMPPTEAEGLDLEISISYDIAIVNGNANNLQTPSDELIAAMNDLAPRILDASRRLLLRGRKLAAVDIGATSIDSLETIGKFYVYLYFSVEQLMRLLDVMTTV
jgi:cell division septation protein DedD